MDTPIEMLFERELERRGIPFKADPDTGTYSLQARTTLVVSLANLARQYANEGDPECVPAFVDAILDQGSPSAWDSAKASVLFALEPNDYEVGSDLRSTISQRVDRVPVLVNRPWGTWRFVMRAMLEQWGVTENGLEQAANAALASALASAKVDFKEIDGVRLGHFETELPLKSPLLLAPNLKQIVEPIIGWPLHAVVPDQDFIWIWDARHERFGERVGAVVVREYSEAPHPVTTELFNIDHDGIRAFGAFTER